MKKSIAAALLLAFLLQITVSAKAPSVSAESAILMDGLTEAVLFSHCAEVRRGMASTTKIMTALVALEQYDLSQHVTVQPEWCGAEGSSMYLVPGEDLTVEALLYGLLLESGNDAAIALAGLDPDGDFVAKMNEKAAVLGLKDTHFDNPSGLDWETHYTTAYDLARLTVFAMRNEVFAHIVSTKSIRIGAHDLQNHNRLLREVDACGVKTGYTMACGRCLVSAKQQDGRLLICVTLKDHEDWKDHKALLDYGFSLYHQTEICGAGDCGAVPLVGSEKAQSRLYSNESFSFSLRDEEAQQISIRLFGPRFLYGGAAAGAPYGKLCVFLGRQKLFETEVFLAENAKEKPIPRLWERVQNLFSRRSRH